jgi:carbon monoxide dehydrogenase subunit G
MARDRFSRTFPVAAAPDAVLAHLSDPHSYVGLAPLIVAVRDVRAEGNRVSYVSVERFRLGPLHWDNPIRVTMTTDAAALRVTSHVRSPGWVTLDSVVDLVPRDEGGTDVTETVELSCPAVLRGFVVREAKRAQDGRATELTRRMAGPDRRS